MELTNTAFAAHSRRAADQLREAHELGVEVLCLARCEPPPDLEGFPAVLAASGARIGHLELGGLLGGEEAENLPLRIAARDDAERQAAWKELQHHLAQAAALDCSRLLLPAAPPPDPGLAGRIRRLVDMVGEGRAAATAELVEELRLQGLRGRDEMLDRFCRALHSLFRAAPGLEVALATAPCPGHFPDFDSLEFVFEDLRAYPLSYWHDTAAAHSWESLGGGPAWSWLERHAARMSGVYLGDAIGVAGGRVPGQGEVDFKDLRAHLPRGARRVLHLASGTSRMEVIEGLRVLQFHDLDS